MCMDKRVKISIMLDFYGELLTPKQRDIMELYYNNDLSLSEIAEGKKTSRQAIHDLIKRGEKLLNDYEQKLNLAKKSLELEKSKKDINCKLDLLEEKDKEKGKPEELIKEIRIIINEKF